MRYVCAVLFLLLCGTFPVHADSVAGTEHVKVHLVADKAVVAPGDTVTLAIVEDIIPEWHTYWQNPGDSGIAPTMSWSLPTGFTASPIHWPAPQRLAYGPLVNFGYADHVVLLTDVKVPESAILGSSSLIKVNFSWLVCQESCIPESAKLDIALPIESRSGVSMANASLFEQARAKLPSVSPFIVGLSADSKVITLKVDDSAPTDAFFFPFKGGLIDNSSRQVLHRDGNGFTLQMARGELRQPLEMLEGVLEISDSPVEMTPFVVSARSSALPATAPIAETSEIGLLAALGLALVGGMILNLMPCVFPVLSLKVLALARHAQNHETSSGDSGVAYTLGILVAFAGIAALLLGLRAAGTSVGWGFQLQSPPFVLCLAYLLFVMGLSLSGLFTVSDRFANFGSRLASRQGFAGSFFTGALAALVATPCSAPFMSTAVGFAVTQPWPIALAIIETLGLGLALPYLLLASRPKLVGFLPKPGPWMDRLKQFLAFPLYGSAVWLLWVLALQSGPDGVLLALGGAVLLAFALWCVAQSHTLGRRSRHVALIVAALCVLLALAGAASPMVAASPRVASAANSFIPQGWEPYSAARLEDLQHNGTPVFLDMSAAWCLTCILNERVALGPSMVEEMHRKGIVLLKGDWTNQDPAITSLLASFGRNGVPLYVYYPPDLKPPVVLPQLLTPEIVTDIIGNG